MNNKTHNEATARPWEAVLMENNQPCSITGGGRTIAWVDFWQDKTYAKQIDLDTQQANAALIVRAVNEHEALKLALEDALYSIRALDENYDSRPSYVQGQKLLTSIQKGQA
jgi:hypothetical protein